MPSVYLSFIVAFTCKFKSCLSSSSSDQFSSCRAGIGSAAQKVWIENCDLRYNDLQQLHWVFKQISMYLQNRSCFAAHKVVLCFETFADSWFAKCPSNQDSVFLNTFCFWYSTKLGEMGIILKHWEQLSTCS